MRNGQVLLGLRAPHRRSYPNRWDVLGGLVESGETVEQALVRELGEEVGVVPLRWTLLGSMTDPRNERGAAVYHMHAVTAWSGQGPAILDDEHTRLEWFDVAAACALPDLALDEYRPLLARAAQA